MAKKPNGRTPGSFSRYVHGPKDGPHFITGTENGAWDITTGTYYSRFGNTIIGSDGSMRTVIDNGSSSTLFGSDGIRTIHHYGDSDFII